MIVATELLTCWFVRADCSTADEPGQVPQIGGLSNFGKVSTKKLLHSNLKKSTHFYVLRHGLKIGFSNHFIIICNKNVHNISSKTKFVKLF